MTPLLCFAKLKSDEGEALPQLCILHFVFCIKKERKISSLLASAFFFLMSYTKYNYNGNTKQHNEYYSGGGNVFACPEGDFRYVC